MEVLSSSLDMAKSLGTVYYMLLLRAPIHVVNNLQRIHRNFCWGMSGTNRKFVSYLGILCWLLKLMVVFGSNILLHLKSFVIYIYIYILLNGEFHDL